MRDDKENLIVKLTFEFALDIIEFTEELESIRKYAIANQLIRCGTSIGANVREAQNAESKADFIHKIKSLPKKPTKQSTFYCFVNSQGLIRLIKFCSTSWWLLSKFCLRSSPHPNHNISIFKFSN